MQSAVRHAPLLLILACLAALLAGCGGGDDDPAPASTPTTTSGSSTVAAAPLVLSASSPASVNGTLDKTLAAGNNEAGISNASGAYVSAGPNDYCRVAVYQMTDSGDAKKYNLEVVFAKSGHQVSFVGLSLDGASATFSARAASPVAGATVDVANRRIGFSNTVLGTAGGNTTTLNGSLEYGTNASAADRASCG